MKYFSYNKFIIPLFGLLFFIPIQASRDKIIAVNNVQHAKNLNFVKAILNGEVEKVKEFLKKQKNINFFLVDLPGQNYPLHYSVDSGKLDIAKLLMQHKGNLHLRNQAENTPFLHAIITSENEIAQYFYEQDRTVINDVITKTGRSALFLASINSNTKMVQWLLNLKENSLNPNDCDKTGYTILTFLLKYKISKPELDFCEIIELLLTNGANANLLDNNNYSPIHIASSYHLHRETELLIKFKADVNLVEPKGGSTPLMLVSVKHDYADQFIKLLLNNGADLEQKNLELKNSNFATALYFAIINSNHKIFETLIKYGANFNSELLYITLNFKKPEICDAWLNSKYVSVEQKQKLLLSLPKDGNEDPFFLTVIQGKVDRLQKFLSLFNNPVQLINSIKIPGSLNTLLHLAIIFQQFEMTKYLINDLHMDVNAVNAWGDTPLHLAVMYRCVPAISLLIASGANKNLQNDNKDIAAQLIPDYLNPTQKRQNLHMKLILEKEPIKYDDERLGPVGEGKTHLKNLSKSEFKDSQDDPEDIYLNDNNESQLEATTSGIADNNAQDKKIEDSASVTKEENQKAKRRNRDFTANDTKLIDSSKDNRNSSNKLQAEGKTSQNLLSYGRPVLFDETEVKNLDDNLQYRVRACFNMLKQYGLRAVDSAKLHGLRNGLNFWRIDIGLSFRILVSITDTHYKVEGMGQRENFYEKFIRSYQ